MLASLYDFWFLYQGYEARLFRSEKICGGMATSAEEAVDLQKKNSALNRFYQNLSLPNKDLTSPSYKESKKRDVGKVVVSYFISLYYFCSFLKGAKMHPFFFIVEMILVGLKFLPLVLLQSLFWLALKVLFVGFTHNTMQLLNSLII